ncbi:MAG: hypothetical protein V4596_12215 [Bdellovibrionota bacterium]
MKNIINNISIITSLSALVTSITVLLSIPNSVVDYFNNLNWEKNVKIIRASSNDFIVVYNGNSKPVFVSHINFRSDYLGAAGAIEINQTALPKSYLSYSNPKDHISYDGLFRGGDESLKDIIIKHGFVSDSSPYRILFFTSGHPQLVLFETTNNMPRLFNVDVRLFISMENITKELKISANGIVIKKK